MKRLLLIFMFLSFGLGCSSQYRSIPTDDIDYVLGSYAEVSGAATTSMGTDSTKFKQMLETPGASIYYADALPDGAFGPVISVSSLSSYAFFGKPDLGYDVIEDVRLFFVYVPYTDGTVETALMMAIKEKGQASYEIKYFMGTQTFFDNGEMISVLAANQQDTLVLRTNYLDENDELEAVIKMYVSEFDSSGQEVDIGQFSTLVGYSIF